MKVLVINAGSSSLKYQLIDMETEQMICKGNCERIGLDESFIKYQKDEDKRKEFINFSNHKEAFKIVIDKLTNGDLKVIDNLSEISAIGHRVVHGKDFVDPTLVTEDVINELEKLVEYAPKHIPGAVTGVRACMEIAPSIPNVLVFDTAFHKTMPDEAKTYAIPYKYIEEYGIKKYGAHGSSHKFIAGEVAKLLKRDDIKLINCHIGSGASLCAIKNGKCIDTSMGFTPLAGLVMGTRSGDIDPSVIAFLSKKTGKTAQEIIDMLNNESGLLGLCGKSDSRDVEEGIESGDKLCKLAFDTMILSVVKYIGSYVAELGGVDVITFTAGIGENSPKTREAIMDKLAYLGIKCDKEANDMAHHQPNTIEISTKDSKVKVYVLPTNEEIVIARDTLELVKNLKLV